MNDEVLFWHTEKHQSLLQLDTIIFGVCNQACPKYPKYEICTSLKYLQKSIRGKADFLPANKHKGFLQVVENPKYHFGFV